MKQRKTLKIWQMIIIIVLCVGLLTTMFLPAYQFNGRNMYKMNKLLGNINEESDKEEIQEGLEIIDKVIKWFEEKFNCKISNLTPGYIMVQSMEENKDTFDGLDAFDGLDDYLEKEGVSSEMRRVILESLSEYLLDSSQLNSLEKDLSKISAEAKPLRTMQRVICWITYLLAIAVIILMILGFCFKWSKYISLAVSAVYGVAAATIFGLLQFWLPSAFGKSLIKCVSDGMNLPGMNLELFAPVIGKVYSCYLGIAFLVGFIIAILLVIISVVSMFVGGYDKERVYKVPDDYDCVLYKTDPWEEERARQERERQERERRERERKERERLEELERQRQDELKRQQQVSMGQVKCTKGVSVGQGFSLPEDRKVIVGKSAQNANLVINNPSVSNIHCSIRYRASSNTYIVKDHSLNGTFVNGVRLQKNVEMLFPAGTVLQLADGSNEITLG